MITVSYFYKEFKKIRIMSHIENYLTIETQTEDNDRRPSLAELQAEDRVSILSFKTCIYVYNFFVLTDKKNIYIKICFLS